MSVSKWQKRKVNTRSLARPVFIAWFCLSAATVSNSTEETNINETAPSNLAEKNQISALSNSK